MRGNTKDFDNEAMMQLSRSLLILPLIAALAACERAPEEAPDTAATPPATEQTEAVSIMRPDIELPEAEPTEPKLMPFRAIVAFAEGGTRLSDETEAVLTRIMETEQMGLGGPITLRSHTDSAGDDDTNLEVSEARGLAIAEWLIERGVDADRITVIALGEQNPIQPNANPDGSPFARGRAANRRVEIEIGLEPATGKTDASEPAEGAER